MSTLFFSPLGGLCKPKLVPMNFGSLNKSPSKACVQPHLGKSETCGHQFCSINNEMRVRNTHRRCPDPAVPPVPTFITASIVPGFPWLHLHGNNLDHC